jgi:hypothetical protein
MDENQEIESGEDGRWTLIRDAAVLQVKLIVDGLRDFLLVPASLVAAVLSVFSAKDGRPGPQFYQLLAMGKRSERWINLFGAIEHAPAELAENEQSNDLDFDELVGKFENFVVDEYKRGGITSQAKQRIDRAIDVIQRRGSKPE